MENLYKFLSIIVLFAGTILAIIFFFSEGSDGEFVSFIILCATFLGFYLFYSFYNDEHEKSGAAEKEREELRMQKEAEHYIATHPEEFAPWERKYLSYQCPYCGRYKVRYANWDDKKMSVAFWGMASSKIGKTYTCDACKNFWE